MELMGREEVSGIKTRNWTKSVGPCPSCGWSQVFKIKSKGGIIVHCPNCALRYGVKGTKDIWQASNFFATSWRDEDLVRWSK